MCLRMWEIWFFFFFFSSRRRHTRCSRDWSSDVCSSDLVSNLDNHFVGHPQYPATSVRWDWRKYDAGVRVGLTDRKSTRLNSSHGYISYAVFCLKKKKKKINKKLKQKKQRTTEVHVMSKR